MASSNVDASSSIQLDDQGEYDPSSVGLASSMVKQEANDFDDSARGESSANSSSINSNDNNNNNGIATIKSDQNVNDEEEKTNLIVNYLPQQMSDEEFENLFKDFGTMKSCKIVRNRVSGYSYGFGFVDFETHEQALKAIDELNGHELETKKIKVAFARPAGQDIKQANLYIKNVPNDWTQDDVKKVFQPYGNIIQVRVLGNNRGVAFVLFDLRKQAEDALDALNGTKVDGCDEPFEIKFAADKKIEKGGNKNSSSTSNNNNPSRSRERGSRGGQGRRDSQRQNNRDNSRGGRQSNQRGGSFFDRQQNNFDDRQGGGARGPVQNQFNPTPYGGGAQFTSPFNNMNGAIGPVRQAPINRMNRYAPFIPVQQALATNPIAAPQMTVTQMAPNPAAYGYPAQQPMIPFTMMPTQQLAPIQPVNQAGQQLAQTPMTMYGTTAAPMSIAYAPVAAAQNVNNIYSVASNNMNNAANMQPQIGQPMTLRDNMNSTGTSNTSSGYNNGGGGGGGGSSNDGVTLFVYNIGPDSDEDELKTLFAPYGHVVKCNVVRKTPGGETKGFGFVTLKSMEQANSAISGLNGSMRNGRALQVSLKK